jgi:hypothetical protein
MTFRRIVRIDPEPETLFYACHWHVGETQDGLVQCGTPGEIWVVAWHRGSWGDFIYCRGCYEKFRTAYPEAPLFEAVPLVI